MLSLYDELRRSEEDALARMDQAITEAEAFREERDALKSTLADAERERDEWKQLFDTAITKITERLKELDEILKT